MAFLLNEKEALKERCPLHYYIFFILSTFPRKSPILLLKLGKSPISK